MIFARRLIAAWLVSGTMFPNGTHRRSNNASPRGKWRYCSTPLFFRPRSRWRWPVARQDCFLFHQSVLPVLEITREREKNNELANSFCFHNFKNFEISRQAYKVFRIESILVLRKDQRRLKFVSCFDARNFCVINRL